MNVKPMETKIIKIYERLDPAETRTIIKLLYKLEKSTTSSIIRRVSRSLFLLLTREEAENTPTINL